jgi:tRNA(Ile2)-agmatinylcytidine synthase
VLLHIGFDDTDSPSGGCTTYIAARLVEELSSIGARFVDYPNLLRLNPNVPWKTRGNGAVCLRIDIEKPLEEDARRAVLKHIEAYSDFECENTNPGIVILEGEVPPGIVEFSDDVVRGVVTLDDALKTIDEYGASAKGYKNMRGVIGGLAAVGGLQRGDHTYEFLAYRLPENWGTPRRVDPDSVIQMDEATERSTFNNVDPETGRVLIAPNGPDPVLFGVRGEDPAVVCEAGLMVDSEPLERWVIFRANQGTDAHLGSPASIESLEPYSPAVIEGMVSDAPKTIKGGHVFVGLTGETGRIDCAAYEPTGSFRGVVRGLIPGDRVRAYGGVRGAESSERPTFNVEKLEVLKLARDLRKVNPACPECGGSMESMGREKGFRCRSCGFRGPEMAKDIVEKERQIGTGLYMTPPRAQRHLMKPKVRYGREKKGLPRMSIEDPWHWP